MKIKYNSQLLLIFIASIIFHALFLLSDTYRISVYPDGIRFIDQARNIYNSSSFEILGVAGGYKKIGYPLLISPFFSIEDIGIRYKAITLFNIICFSAAIFPFVAILKRFNINSKYRIALSALFMFSAEIMSSYTYMSESIYWPLSLTALYISLKLIDRPNMLKGVAFGLLIFFVYTIKEIALLFPLSILAYALLKREKKLLLCGIASMVIFVATYIPFNLLLFGNISNSYNQTSIPTPDMICAFLYEAVVNFVGLGAIFMGFPLALCLRYKTISHIRCREYGLFLSLLYALYTLTITYTISIRESFHENWLNCEPQTRYFAMFSLVYMAIYIKYVDAGGIITKHKLVKVIALGILFSMTLKHASKICNWTFSYYDYLRETPVFWLMIPGLYTIVYCLFLKSKKQLLAILMGIALITSNIRPLTAKSNAALLDSSIQSNIQMKNQLENYGNILVVSSKPATELITTITSDNIHYCFCFNPNKDFSICGNLADVRFPVGIFCYGLDLKDLDNSSMDENTFNRYGYTLDTVDIIVVPKSKSQYVSLKGVKLDSSLSNEFYYVFKNLNNKSIDINLTAETKEESQ